MPRFKREIIQSGTKFGTTTYIRDISTAGASVAVFLCECGKEFGRRVSKVKSGDSPGCGCKRRLGLGFKKFREQNPGGNNVTHGHTRGQKPSKEYTAWAHMHQRCHDPNENYYYRYGGRGISVCERWRKFENFYEDMGEKPSPNHSLGRINSDGDYEPGNCRWETMEQQQNNTAQNVFLEANGIRQTTAQWARATGMSADRIRARIRLGWTTEEVLGLVPRVRPNT